MKTHFEELMEKKTANELWEYLNNADRYRPEMLTAAVNELKARGNNFSDEELQSIRKKIEIQQEIEEDSFYGSSNTLKKDEVNELDAPLFYSKTSIMFFSTIFSVIFGSVLLSLNIDKRSRKFIVLGIGVLFTVVAVTVGNVAQSLKYVFLINAVGGYVLTSDFWHLYIGRGIKYRAKPIWIPLIISILLSALYWMAIING